MIYLFLSLKYTILALIHGRLSTALPLKPPCYLPDWIALRENAYWIAFDGGFGLHMVSFDFRTERFSRVALPFQNEDRYDTVVLSVVKDGQPSVLYENPYESTVAIWVTDEISEGKEVSWREFLQVDGCNFMEEEEEEEDGDRNLQSFLLGEENEVAVCGGTKRQGNEEVDRIFIVGQDLNIAVLNDETRKGRAFHNSPLLLSYVPSLVRLEKDKAKGRKRKRTTRRLVT